MRQRMDRVVAAGVAATLGCALLCAGPAGPARAADDGSTGATPSPTVPVRPPEQLTSIGGLGSLLVTPLFERLLLTAGAVVTQQQAEPAQSVGPAQSVEPGQPVGPARPAQPATPPKPAQPDPATLQPGGGSSATASSWRPKAEIRVPTVVSVPPKGAGNRALTKEQIIWAAYAAAAEKKRSCRIPVMLLAAIGEVESSSLRGRRLDRAHDATPPVRGPALTGGAYVAIRDSDGGRYDGDPVWDRAVGPMQFIPATWRLWGADGNGDGIRDPQNIEDAALAAAGYLCARGRDLSRPADLRAAVLSYNHSERYLSTVLGIVTAVTSGALAGP